MHRGYRISLTILVLGVVGFLFWRTATTIPRLPVNEGSLTSHNVFDEGEILGEIGADDDIASSTETTLPPSLTAEDGVHEVIFTESGFSPKISTIKVGETIIFKNESQEQFSVASNPHPAHTDLKNFDAKKALNPGESYSFTFTKAGTWRYHNEFNFELGGTVIVLK